MRQIGWNIGFEEGARMRLINPSTVHSSSNPRPHRFESTTASSEMVKSMERSMMNIGEATYVKGESTNIHTIYRSVLPSSHHHSKDNSNCRRMRESMRVRDASIQTSTASTMRGCMM